MKQEFRDFVDLLEYNGYSLSHVTGSHHIYKNKYGKHISINIEPNKMVLRRLIKKNHLKEIK